MIKKIAIIVLFATPALAAPDLLEKQGRTDDIKQKNSEAEASKSLVFKNTLEFENSINNTDEKSQSLACEASLSLDYSQKESGLEVETVLTNYTCDASQGSYQITVEYLDVDGRPRSFEATESWLKRSASDFTGKHRYPIDFEVEIQKVRGRLLMKQGCACLQAPIAAGEE